MFKRFLLFCAAGLLLPLGSANAALEVQITGGAEGAQPIAIVPFGEQGAEAPQDISAIVSNDLRGSGKFAPVAEQNLLARPHDAAEVNFPDWRILGQNLVIGKVNAVGGQYQVQFELFDVFSGAQLVGYRFNSGPQDLRRVAHQISDIIYEKLTGQPGAFNTRIAYVTVSGSARRKGRTYSLQVADSDGYDSQVVLTSKQPVLSPAWSPDGSRLAYVSFEKDRQQIYTQELGSGRRELIASYPGLNGAPAWSPDGRRLALTLSKDGNPEIYVLNLGSKALSRLTQNAAIDTEPSWSADGGSIVFTSDRGGRPQIYRMSASGGSAQRVTFDGDYNARGEVSPDGQFLATIQGGGNSFHIALTDLKSGQTQPLSDGPIDESPSFAPNGSMVIYATNKGGKGQLEAVSVDGLVRQSLVSQEGDVREAAWSPFGRKLDFQATQP